jgi:hypothetical protein
MTLKKQALDGVKWKISFMLIVTVLQVVQLSILALFFGFSRLWFNGSNDGFHRFSPSVSGHGNQPSHNPKPKHYSYSTFEPLVVKCHLVSALCSIDLEISALVASFYNEPRIIQRKWYGLTNSKQKRSKAIKEFYP